MRPNERILLALDDSDASRRALGFVAREAAAGPPVRVTVGTVRRPLPPELLESRGAEDPVDEERIECGLRARQQRAAGAAVDDAARTLADARTTLERAGVAEVDAASIDGTGHDVAERIVALADATGCRTIVVGRSSFPWLAELLREHVADRLREIAGGRTVHVVE